MSDGQNRLRSLLATALTLAAIAASVLAIAALLALVWWVRSLSSPAPQEAAAPVRPLAREPVARAPRDVAAPPRQAAAQRMAAAAPPPPTAAPTTGPPTRGANDDAAKNRALGAALSRLGNDPELQRKLQTGR